MKIMTARAKRVTSLQLSIVVLAALTATSVTGQTRQTPKTDFGSVLKAGPADLGAMHADATALRQEIEDEATRFADAARIFGSRLTAAEHRDLQGACEAVVASEGDARTQRQGQSLDEVACRHRASQARHCNTRPRVSRPRYIDARTGSEAHGHERYDVDASD